jgi:hypothetical protein
VSAHKILEQIIDLQCMIAKSTFYRQPKSNETVLKIAHEEDYRFLEQAELKAIN